MNREQARQVYDFLEIKRRVPLAAVLERYGVLGYLKRVGNELVGACPLHGGRNKRQFTVSLDKGLWHCFGDCDAGGGPLEFTAAMENVGLKEAAEMIAGWFAIAPSRSASSQHGKRRSKPMSETNRPTHKVYSAAKREGQKDFLTRIGSAWPFSMKDGKTGLNIQLSAMPIGDRMVLFEYDDEEPEAQEQPEKKGNGRRK